MVSPLCRSCRDCRWATFQGFLGSLIDGARLGPSRIRLDPPESTLPSPASFTVSVTVSVTVPVTVFVTVSVTASTSRLHVAGPPVSVAGGRVPDVVPRPGKL